MASLPPQRRQLPPWNGPPQGTPVLDTTLGPLERPSVFPFDDANVQNPNIFPPVCLRTHWDPEKIIHRTLPAVQVATPLEPRPWTKICMNYVTSQDFEHAPRPNDNLVMPSGGVNYPPTRFIESIDSAYAALIALLEHVKEINIKFLLLALCFVPIPPSKEQNSQIHDLLKNFHSRWHV